jgi:D-arabinose 1-dehydrogenase-like Zn-dependent alcohol dehydrogenase
VGYDTRRLDQTSKLARDGAVRPTVNAGLLVSRCGQKAYELMSSAHVRGKIVLDMRKAG